MPPVLPPGTILQILYLRERLARIAPGRFIEVGTGRGELASVLLDAGWHGVGYELSESTAGAARERNPGSGFDVRVADWLSAPDDEPADLVLSSMVIEHLPDDEEAAYFARARRVLRPGGRIALFVPAGPRYWGIEDDIAGHQRRYTRAGLTTRLGELGWRVDHVAGLTFPLANALLPLSNVLVRRAEGERVGLSELDRTVLSGDRDVAGKTTFPRAAGVVLNPVALYPFHVLQKAFRDTDRALVMYAEATPDAH
jgi:SAM-dependent methyltransferase